MKVSFSGIYDVRFPAGTKDNVVDTNVEKAKTFIKENLSLNGVIDVTKMDHFHCDRSENLSEKGIRIATSIDNPWFLCSLFDSMDKKLGQEYVDKAKVELIFDTQA